MQRFTVRLHHDAQKELDALPLKARVRVQRVIFGLTSDPFQGKKLDGEYHGYYSIRVWPYRVIYSVYKDQLIVYIIKVGHRQGVY